MRSWWILVPFLLMAASVWSSCGSDKKGAATAAMKNEFVGSEKCKECHEERHETWLETAHAYSLRSPTADVVEGNFDGTPFESEHFTATPYMKDGRWFIKVVGKDGRPDGDHEVTRVVGREFEQAYLTTDHRGRWPVLPICWSIERKEWDATHLVLEDISGHTGAVSSDYDTRLHIFNHGCGQCHATDYDVGHDPETNTLHSTFLEGAVACESCHGPGSIHTHYHENEGEGDEEAARLLSPKKDFESAEAILQSCGRCHYTHKWMYAIDDDPRVGHEQIAISLHFDRDGFFADGRLAGLNYHGTTQSHSACYVEGGMSCLSCHKMHGGFKFAMKWEGSSPKQCTQCHDKDKYETEAHTHHTPAGATCVDCHMPKFLTGVLHFMRDHTIRSPDPALTERFGSDNAPNACNQCHQDQTASWAREHREKWWGPGDAKMMERVGLVMRIRSSPAGVPVKELVEAAADESSNTFFRMTATQALLADPARVQKPETRDALRSLLSTKHVEMLQLLTTAYGAYPDDKATADLLKLIDHPNRPVRVLAGYAAIRSGWRGGHGADEKMKALYPDALKMLERQNQIAERLEIIAFYADVLGKGADLDDFYGRIQRIAPEKPGQWRGGVIELLHRRARAATEAGQHGAALNLYNEVRAATKASGVPLLLNIDAADSLAAMGERGAAEIAWKRVLASSRPGSAFFTLAQARLSYKNEDLKKWIRVLSLDPSGGELLRRFRWALNHNG